MVATEPPRSYTVVGTRPLRPDGTDKVTGRARYGPDVQLPGMLYGRVKRSPHAGKWSTHVPKLIEPLIDPALNVFPRAINHLFDIFQCFIAGQ